MDAVALAAGEVPDLLLLVRPLEVEPGDVGARGNFALAERHLIEASGKLLEDRVVRVESLARLVHVRDDDGVADADLAFVGLLLADEDAKECCLARAVGAYDADDAARRQAERHAFEDD